MFAGVLPEDKFKLVKTYQAAGHTVGMCGDGANDAPALRQAQIGIAVSRATDVAKSAAGMVLTEPGLAGIVSAVSEGRHHFSARAHLYAELDHQEDRPGPVHRRRAHHDRACGAHAIVDGPDHDRWRHARNVADDGQRASVPASQSLARRPTDGGGRAMGAGQLVFSLAVLAVGDFVRLRTSDPETLGVPDNRLRQPSDNLQQSRAPAPLVFAPKLLAGRLFGSRHDARLRPSRRGDRDGASAIVGGRKRARRRRRFRSSDGLCESPPVSPPFLRLKRTSSSGSRSLWTRSSTVRGEPIGLPSLERPGVGSFRGCRDRSAGAYQGC